MTTLQVAGLRSRVVGALTNKRRLLPCRTLIKNIKICGLEARNQDSFVGLGHQLMPLSQVRKAMGSANFQFLKQFSVLKGNAGTNDLVLSLPNHKKLLVTAPVLNVSCPVVAQSQELPTPLAYSPPQEVH